MNELVLKSDNGIVLRFHSRQLSDNGWLDSYEVTAEAPGFRASLRADNPPYGSSPADFFARVAANWSGWEGVEEWGATEGEYSLSATSDSTGHVTLVAEFQPYQSPASWNATLSVVLEAGAIERLARDAREFFGPSAEDEGIP